MNKIINIKERSNAIKDVTIYKDKKYMNIDVKFINVHIRKINKLIGEELFKKNDLYISSETLWEIMQPEGKSVSHNYHNLSPEDIVISLNKIIEPLVVCEVKFGRYAIISSYISHFDEPLMFVIEIGAGLINNQTANINKIVTIYPKSDRSGLITTLYDKDKIK